MSDSKLVKAGFGYTIGNYLLKGLSVISIPLFTRLLSADDYGRYSIFTSYESILFVIIGFAIHSSYKNARYRFRITEDETNLEIGYRSYVSATMLLLVVSVFIWLIIGNVFSFFFIRFLDLDILSINLLIAYSFASAVIMCFNVDKSLQYQYKSFLILSGINALCNILLSLLLICTFFSSQRYIGRIIGTTIPAFILSVGIAIIYLRKSKAQTILYFAFLNTL